MLGNDQESLPAAFPEPWSDKDWTWAYPMLMYAFQPTEFSLAPQRHLEVGCLNQRKSTKAWVDVLHGSGSLVSIPCTEHHWEWGPSTELGPVPKHHQSSPKLKNSNNNKVDLLGPAKRLNRLNTNFAREGWPPEAIKSSPFKKKGSLSPTFVLPLSLWVFIFLSRLYIQR